MSTYLNLLKLAAKMEDETQGYAKTVSYLQSRLRIKEETIKELERILEGAGLEQESNNGESREKDG